MAELCEWRKGGMATYQIYVINLRYTPMTLTPFNLIVYYSVPQLFVHLVFFVWINTLTALRFWREPKNSHRTQESPPWRASATSSGSDSTVNPDLMQTGRGRVVGGGVGRSDLLSNRGTKRTHYSTHQSNELHRL
jgi:hypothetical protein